MHKCRTRHMRPTCCNVEIDMTLRRNSVGKINKSEFFFVAFLLCSFECFLSRGCCCAMSTLQHIRLMFLGRNVCTALGEMFIRVPRVCIHYKKTTTFISTNVLYMMFTFVNLNHTQRNVSIVMVEDSVLAPQRS